MKNKLIKAGIIFLNLIGIYFIADNRWINVMPTFPEEKKTFLEVINNQLLGKDFITIFMAIVTIVLVFVISKYFLKEEIKIKKYLLLFMVILILNMLTYMISINYAF